YQYHGTVKQGDTPQAVFIANPFYQRPGRPSRPRIKEIHLVVPRDPVGDFKAGRLQLLLDLPSERVKDLMKAGVKAEDVQTLASRRIYFLAANHDIEALQNQNFRQALAHAIDREAILKAHFRAGFTAIDAQNRLVDKATEETRPLHPTLNGPYPAGSWACAPASRVPENLHDFDLARNKVKAAKLGAVELTLKYPDDDPRVEKACKDICEQIGKLGD